MLRVDRTPWWLRRRFDAPRRALHVWAGPPSVDTFDPEVRARAEAVLVRCGTEVVGRGRRGVIRRTPEGLTVAELRDPDGVDLLWCAWGDGAEELLAAVAAALS